MNCKAILLLIGAGIVSNAHAQDSTDKASQIPAGPLINLRASNHSSWTVELKAGPGDFYSQDNSADILNRAYIKTDKTVHVQLNSSGAIWDVWNVGDYHAFISPDGKYVQLAGPGGNNPFYVDLSQSDFEGFSWINRSNFQGIKEVDGKTCLVFSAELKVINLSPVDSKNNVGASAGSSTHSAYRFAANSSAAQAMKSAQSQQQSTQNAEAAERALVAEQKERTFQYMAAVNLETRLPVKESTPQGLYVFTFAKEPAASEQVPALVQNFIESLASRKTALATRVIAPY